MQRLISALALVTSAGVAGAHPVLEQPKAAAGATYKAVFMVSHGCKGSPTARFTVRVPEGVRGAKPQPKPGWNLATRDEALAVPYEQYGRKVTRNVIEVTWAGGRLPNAHYDEFVILMKLPDAPGRLYFKAAQECEQGRMDWVDVAADPGDHSGFPAPALDVSRAESDHAHHH
jgi:uncharacterized protein YcnI